MFALELDPSDLRGPRIYVICLVAGFFFALLKEFGYLGPHYRPLVGTLFFLVAIFVSFAKFFRR